MKDNWTDFEKWVFQKLEKIDSRMTKLEIKAAVFGASAAVLVHVFWHHF